jgi:hypothetical protein
MKELILHSSTNVADAPLQHGSPYDAEVYLLHAYTVSHAEMSSNKYQKDNCIIVL